MPRPCTACTHPDAAAVDEVLVAGRFVSRRRAGVWSQSLCNLSPREAPPCGADPPAAMRRLRGSSDGEPLAERCAGRSRMEADPPRSTRASGQPLTGVAPTRRPSRQRSRLNPGWVPGRRPSRFAIASEGGCGGLHPHTPAPAGTHRGVGVGCRGSLRPESAIPLCQSESHDGRVGRLRRQRVPARTGARHRFGSCPGLEPAWAIEPGTAGQHPEVGL